MHKYIIYFFMLFIISGSLSACSKAEKEVAEVGANKFMNNETRVFMEESPKAMFIPNWPLPDERNFKLGEDNVTTKRDQSNILKKR